ncbi:hypothetical protein Poli38472_010929 [Pythium oligandrum]|uniref:Alpha-type protein kinase domain-containing protein n=1 Tax=Pythium oligandrum TaxID=41045 RepID=A0A8K1CEC1_PYTOL|nr:hypothetical protein Poli38472_010929 [Pythium oligandrum]|eukprot:TMW61866.1 hypothetical protein Poli38472_010929 [Pythium oligandrum]
MHAVAAPGETTTEGAASRKYEFTSPRSFAPPRPLHVRVAGDAGEAVHTLHVQVPADHHQTINMSLRVNISTSATPVVNISTSAQNNTTDVRAHDALPPPSSSLSSLSSSGPLSTTASTASSSASGPVTPMPLALPPPSVPPHPLSSQRKRKTGHNKKPASKERDNEQSSPRASWGGNMHAPGSGGGGRGKSPFEKLNTLKMLLDCGHLTEEEYQERKTQIINEMTGTSTERKKPSPRRTLQPIMKTVVPHPPPDFSRIMKERAEKLSFDVDTLEWNANSTRIKLDLVPFATGQLRNAYFLQDLGEPEPRLLVAKFSIRHAEPSTYLSDVEMQAVCAHYAALYNEHEPPLKVYYARSWLLKLKDRGDLVCSVEEYLPGAYVKYSNNNGFVGKETSTTEERERNTPHAFSHFTFVASDYRLMVVDIQGVNDSYTDPQIHTADGRGFGAGNLGTFGMEKFLESHRCNEVCRWLGLKSINKQYKPGGTAAPQYQMPFGGNIKKSTSRITEERNTFSRSVTVSEAFGGSDLMMMRAAAMVDDEPDPFSSSISTCATSSSMLYGAGQTPLMMMEKAYEAVVGPAAAAAGSGGAIRVGSMPIMKSIDGPRGDRHQASFWDILRRLMCCCLGH